MANSVTGKITFISQIFSVETRNGSFEKRELWLAPMYFDRDSGEPTASDAKQSISFEFTRSNVHLLDQFKVGEEIVVPFRLRGNVYEKDGANRCINTVEGIGVRYYNHPSSVAVQEPQNNQPEPVQQVQASDPLPF